MRKTFAFVKGMTVHTPSALLPREGMEPRFAQFFVPDKKESRDMRQELRDQHLPMIEYLGRDVS